IHIFVRVVGNETDLIHLSQRSPVLRRNLAWLDQVQAKRGDQSDRRASGQSYRDPGCSICVKGVRYRARRIQTNEGGSMSKSIHMAFTGAAILGLAGLALAADQPATHHAAAAEGTKPAPTDEELVASAMKAAPKKVAESATIVAPDPKGGMRTLRKGTNGFTCMPDNPETPGPDPMCWDKNAGDWIDAYLNHKTPPAGKIGLMYMLA